MAGFDYLYLAQFAVQAGSAIQQNQQANLAAAEQRIQANQQIAINNKLSYNAHLNLNQQQLLEMQKFKISKFELQKNIRREQAKNAAIKASFGGSFGQEGASYAATIQNINRHGLSALARKDFNFKTQVANFNIRQRNIQLETQSKNNKALTGLSTGGSLAGTGLSILGSGIQAGINNQKGTTKTQ
tara:strand:- start:12167 stop:12724 length:558 start_codon:yes stop_codon:yes gene_type:complete